MVEAEEDVSPIHPEWFLDLPEELDVCVAQRHFEDAIVLLQKGKDYITQLNTQTSKVDHILMDVQRKVKKSNHI